jgi:hypothetical protein
MEIAGLPLHPLVVHAAVVGIPLVSSLGIALAVAPGWRWLVRWPTAAGAVGVAVVAYLATQTGKALQESRPELAPLVHAHAAHGNRLFQLTLVLAVVVVVSAFLLPGTSGLASGKGVVVSRYAIADKVLPVLLVLVAIATLVEVVLTGDSGARAVWGS